jgi:ATP-binding cassette, subfamily F, member 3
VAGGIVTAVELIRFTDLECHYGAREIFTGLSGVLGDGERIGLVGPNGAGKSSLLRLLAGVETPFGGTIVRARDAKLGYLAQSVADETTATLQQLVDAALERTPHHEAGLKSKTLRIMLEAFGFTASDYDRPLQGFSGGQRAKAALAHLLIDDPDYLILDEPTNHLDIETVRWLEEFIATSKHAFLIVSHDRYFLDRVATRIWELDAGRLHVYPPSEHPYDAFVIAREQRRDEERKAYTEFLAERDKRRAVVAGLRATHTSSDYSQVRSREKQLAKLEEREVAPPVALRRSMALRLEAHRRSGTGFVFETDGLQKAYARTLFDDVTIDVERGERLAVVGPNGSGKSTLLKILAGELDPDAGSVRYNPASKIAYFAQNAHDQLDVDRTAADEVMARGNVNAERAHALLGRMRISGDEADKPVRSFSGGERRRIMLACLMARAADVLLLDEPTNDLDIESREALESVLDEYDGAIVTVSHDRYFLHRLCDRVIWIDGGAWGEVDGGYDAYETAQRIRERQRLEANAAPPARPKTTQLTPLKIKSQLQTQIAKIEREIAGLDARAVEIDRAFADPDTYADRALVAELERERDAVHERSSNAVAEWETLLERYEALSEP